MSFRLDTITHRCKYQDKLFLAHAPRPLSRRAGYATAWLDNGRLDWGGVLLVQSNSSLGRLRQGQGKDIRLALKQVVPDGLVESGLPPPVLRKDLRPPTSLRLDFPVTLALNCR